MKILLENNSFTMDTRESRLSRLELISQNIESYASELSITPEILDWAMNAFEEFSEMLLEQNQISIKKNQKFNIINENEKDFFQRFISFREIISKQIDDSNNILYLRLNEQLPTQRIEKIEFAYEFLSKVESNTPQSLNEMTSLILQNLLEQLSIVKNNYGEALNLQDKGTNLTNRINKKFDQDSINLRTLFNWCVIFWSKKDPKLVDLGFAIPKSTAMNPRTPDIINKLKINKESIKWDNDSKTEKYQLAFRNKFENKEWSVLYEDVDISYNLDIKQGEYKVRGINKFGFGPWSDLVIINENLEKIKK